MPWQSRWFRSISALGVWLAIFLSLAVPLEVMLDRITRGPDRKPIWILAVAFLTLLPLGILLLRKLQSTRLEYSAWDDVRRPIAFTLRALAAFLLFVELYGAIDGYRSARPFTSTCMAIY